MGRCREHESFGGIVKEECELLSGDTRGLSGLDNGLLRPLEVRLIASGATKGLAYLAGSSRLHAVDSKGDSPLHLAARAGNITVCEMFIRAGADPEALNDHQQRPADLALAEGHINVSQRLYSLVVSSPAFGALEVDCEPYDLEAHTDRAEEVSELATRIAHRAMPPSAALDDLENFLNFEPEKSPEDFFIQSARETASGAFVTFDGSSFAVPGDDKEDWELDLSAAQIVGEGIVSDVTAAVDHGAEHNFLKVRRRGPKSVKRTVVQTGTRLSIDPAICTSWAEEVLEKRWCSFYDIEALIVLCEGNGDSAELCMSIQRNLQAAGIEVADHDSGQDIGLWAAKSDVSAGELAEMIEASLTRATQLPGTRKFIMDKSNEIRLLEPIIWAKQELQLEILGCERAVEITLNVLDSICSGGRNAGPASLRAINPARPDHEDTKEVLAAVEALKFWQDNGRVMDGKRRREALAALDAFDLSLVFYKELSCSLAQEPAGLEHASRLDTKVSRFEVATEYFISEHLPYVRRFAARNVGEGEDPEEVFQVAFTGLQRATRRFDPDRGARFVVYCAFWLKQTLMRWRADEGAAIRIPAHRHEKLTKFDSVMARLDVGDEGFVSDNTLAFELEWTVEEVQRFRRIPREAEYPESFDDWDSLLPSQDDLDVFEQLEMQKIVKDALAELPEREANVVRMRFGIERDAEMTLEEIGQLYGLTRERIRQIESKALGRLSHPSRQSRLRELLGK